MSLLLPKAPPLRDPAYLAQVRDMPCVLTGQTPCDPSHIRWGLGGGMGLKPGDDRVLPLRHDLHARQHAMGELLFWTKAIAAETSLSDELLMQALIAYAEARYMRR